MKTTYDMFTSCFQLNSISFPIYLRKTTYSYTKTIRLNFIVCNRNSLFKTTYGLVLNTILFPPSTSRTLFVFNKSDTSLMSRKYCNLSRRLGLFLIPYRFQLFEFDLIAMTYICLQKVKLKRTA